MAELVEECPDCPTGIPAWMATFADLMSLLMCFFVLLLSFSEMDVLKYKQLAGSMRNAFGVQSEINVKDIPKGTSIIAQEFSPARPEPTPINEVRQDASPSAYNTLDIRVNDSGTGEEGPDSNRSTSDYQSEKVVADVETAKQALIEKLKVLIKETEDDARTLASSLRKEISTGKIDIETRGRKIVIRVREQGSFPSGSAQLRSEFIPVMGTVRGVLQDIPGKIAIEGHSDSVPITTSRFRSNWDLSSARALSVAHELFKGEVDQNRFLVTGYADTKPLTTNDNEQNRAKNRRVEIVIHQALDKETSDEVRAMQQYDANFVENLDLDTPYQLRADEIF